MKTPINIKGQKFGRLTALNIDKEKSKNGRIYWLCYCECGNYKSIASYELRHSTKSCGCLLKEITSERNKTHDMTKSREYHIWSNMKARCFNKNNHAYHNYGGRGITVCKPWKDSFISFLNDMGRCPKGLTLDRINNDGNYEPGNCKWSTYTEQARNSRNNRKITIQNDTKIIAEWAEDSRCKISYATLRMRLHRGLSIHTNLLKRKAAYNSRYAQ